MEKTPVPLTRGKAMLYILFCALLWSTGGVLIKFIDANPFTISGWRSFFALIVLLFIYKPSKLKFTKGVWIAAISCTTTGILFVFATKLTTAANAIILMYCSPVFIILIERIFYHQPIIRADVMVSVGCIAGMVLFFLDELSPGNMLGNLLAIMSGITNAVLFVMMNRTTEDRGTINIATQIETIVICLPFMILAPAEFTLKATAAMIALGVMQRAFSIFVYSRASKYCSAMDAILISMVEPLCNPLLVMLFFGEKPGKFALAGGVVVITCVLLWNIVKIKALPPETES